LEAGKEFPTKLENIVILIALNKGKNPMKARFIILIVIICSSCMGGKIPCPEPKTAKLKKNYSHKRYPEYTASATGNSDDLHSQSRVPRDNTKTISNISIEEWDCPRPGMKRYMPKEVKQNIRKNMKKIKHNELAADSTQSTGKALR
jgi:hypothetical protein